jgi:hypothetical protein
METKFPAGTLLAQLSLVDGISPDLLELVDECDGALKYFLALDEWEVGSLHSDLSRRDAVATIAAVYLATVVDELCEMWAIDKLLKPAFWNRIVGITPTLLEMKRLARNIRHTTD